MPFGFKLSHRLSRIRRAAAVLSAGALVACEKPAASVSGPASPSVQIVQVVVTPDATTLIPSQNQQFAAFGRTAGGDTVAIAVEWSTSAGSISPSGLYTAGANVGVYQVTAQASPGTLRGSATVTIAGTPPPAGGSWPNEPAGAALVTDYGFDDAIPLTTADVPVPGATGWYSIYNGSSGGSVTRVTDLTAPFSPANVVDFYYPIGFPSSVGPGMLYYDFGVAKEMYVGLWWKPSNPWQGNDAGRNKICYLATATGKLVALEMFNRSTPYTIGVVTEFPGDTRALQGATTVTLGQWHRLEWYFKYSSSGVMADGQMKVWLDGALEINRTDLVMPADGGFAQFQLAPTFGGNGIAKTEPDHFWFDHLHISRR
jgi:hypothetical protein